MDSKGCSLGRDEALVSTPWVWAVLWIITSLIGVAAVCVCACACSSACDRMSEGETEQRKSY